MEETILELKINLNQKKISSLKEFIVFDNRCNNMQKDTIFTIQLGCENKMELIKEIEEADLQLTDCDGSKKAGYFRIHQFDSYIENTEKEQGFLIFEEWNRKKNTEKYYEIKFPFCFENPLWEKTYRTAFSTIMEEYQEQMKNESKLKNLIVLFVHWISIYFPKLFLRTKTLSKFPKLISTSKIKTNEFLFLRFLAMCGCDVYCIYPTTELEIKWQQISSATYLKKQTYIIEERIPPYQKEQVIEKYQRESQKSRQTQQEKAVSNLQISENHSNSEPQGVVKSQKDSTAKRNLATQENSTVQRDSTAQKDLTTQRDLAVQRNETPSKNLVYQNNEILLQNPEPLQYEEIANMASSIVMVVAFNRFHEANGVGSGILVHKKGYILTNYHVIQDGTFYGIGFEGQEKMEGTTDIVKYHPEDDLALLKISPVNRTPISVYRGKALARGQKVVAIGSPLGLFNTVSDGIISGFRNIHNLSMIQFTAPVSHGSSGGALLDLYGHLIGIVTAGYDSGQNLNLAVDYTTILRFLNDII